MAFKAFGSTPVKQEINVKSNYPKPSTYQQRLSLYATVPETEISIQEFENIAIDRIQLLKTIELASIRNKSKEELATILETSEKKYMPLLSNNAWQTANLDLQRKKDQLSFFICLLAYSENDDLKRWFTELEIKLFRFRYERESQQERKAFLKTCGLAFESISESDKQAMSVDLRTGSAIKDLTGIEFFKVPWDQVYDLVAMRKVYCQNGFAYVPDRDVVSLVLSEYKQRLAEKLKICSNHLSRMDEDDRLKPMLHNLTKHNAAVDYQVSKATGEISAADVDSLAVHFPPCMRHLHNTLKKEKHLKHFGRIQFNLFLKGIGLSLDEALVYWRRAFSKMDDDKFRKEHAYNIRHNFGMEGKRTNYSPKSCMSIITSNQPSVGDQHGCPFKHASADTLTRMLSNWGCPSTQLGDIIDKSRAGHYTVACTLFFESTRPKDASREANKTPGTQPTPSAASSTTVKSEAVPSNMRTQMEVIEHPNRYFDLSLQKSGFNATTPFAKSQSNRENIEIEMECD